MEKRKAPQRDSWFAGLTPEFMKLRYPIPRSLRRECSDLFKDWLSSEDAKDDDKFYLTLARILREAPEVIVKFDDRMMGRRAHKKSFLGRAMQTIFLSNDSIELEELYSLPDDYFPEDSDARKAHRMMFILKDASKRGEDKARPVVEHEASEIASGNWRRLATELASAAARLESPDVEAAQVILKTAQALLEACSAKSEQTKREAEERRKAILVRLELIDCASAETIEAASLTEERMQSIEASLDAAENAQLELTAAEETEADLKQKKQVADQSEDFDRLMELIPHLKTAREDVQKAQERLGAALEDLNKALAGADAPTEPSPVEDDAPLMPVAAAAAPIGQGNAVAESLRVEEAPEVLLSPTPITPLVSPVPPQVEPAITPLEPEAKIPPKASPARAPALDTIKPPVATPGEWPEVVASRIDDLFARYLSAGELAYCYHFASLLEEQGKESPIAAALLRCLIWTITVESPEDVANYLNQSLLAEALNALTVTEQGSDPQRIRWARGIAFATLLRPALFDSGRAARTFLGRLSMVDGLQPYATLASSVSNLGFDVQFSIDDLAEVHGRERHMRAPIALRELKQWVATSQKSRTSHQPTTYMLHFLTGPEGEIGTVVSAVARGADDAPQLVSGLVDRLGNLELFVAEIEATIGRPRRDRIEGLALTWICARLQQGREKLKEWLTARAHDSTISDNRRTAALKRHIGVLTKACEDLPLASASDDDRITASVERLIIERVADFRLVLSGTAQANTTKDFLQQLRLPLLRLPPLCLPHDGEGAEFDQERRLQKHKLFEALIEPQMIAPDLRSAFQRHIGNRSALPAREIVAYLEMTDGADSELREMRQQLQETVESARHDAGAEAHRLHLDLATLLNLDLSAGRDVGARLDQLEQVLAALDANEEDTVQIPASTRFRKAEVPPDFPQLESLLKSFACFRDDLQKRIREDQISRLGHLAGEAARLLEARAADLDPVTLDDMIADIEAGRELAPSEEEPVDPFEAFFPGFVTLLAEEKSLTMGRALSAVVQRQKIGPLDFSSLDETSIRRARQLITIWGQASEAFAARKRDVLSKAVEKLLDLIGFRDVKVESEHLVGAGTLQGLRLKCAVPRPAQWFLPPQFGSEAGGSYRILAASSAVDPQQIARAIGESPDRPWIVLQFSRLERKGREALARSMRLDRRVALTLDESLLLHLAASGGDPLEKLFACGIPFAMIQPYTTNPRNIPPEMFFGRRQEMERIMSLESEGSLIYGGRQLGKSALLNQIRRSMNRPDEGRIAIYLDIVDVGDAPTPTSNIWQRIADALPRDFALTGQKSDAVDIVEAIRKWLERKPERRLLLMLDEADQFLAGEHPAYPHLRKMKDLMESTGWRFKVVFAGLHNVRRLAQAPNSPLVHLGDPVCIGPMNTTRENQRELRKLAIQPMLSAGFTYDPPQLAGDILARVNHYPSLVQVFCKEILGAATTRPRPVGTGPRWKLNREMLFEGGLASRTAAEIRKRFQWTLDLDPRYDLVAKCLALYRLDNTDGHAAVLRDGLSAEVIHDLVENWRPVTLDRDSPSDFRAVLDEMIDLGVLGSKPQGRYGLRNAQVAQLMGSRGEIEREILALAEREPKADYDAATFHRRVILEEPDSLAPLPDNQLDHVISVDRSPFTILVAALALWGKGVGERFGKIAETWERKDGQPFKVIRHGSTRAGLQEQLERTRSGTHLIIIDGPWVRPTYEALVSHLSVRNGKARVIWVMSPADAKLAAVDAPDAIVMRAPLLHDGMLRHWLRGAGLAKLDDRQTRTAILAASGGAPIRLAEMRQLLGDIEAKNPAQRVEEIAAWARSKPLPPEAAGLDEALADAHRKIGSLLSGDPTWEQGADLDTIAQLLPGADVVLPQLVDLGLIEERPKRRIRITFLGQLLSG